jgi:tetratricopeptide (TPR) repeat protein
LVSNWVGPPQSWTAARSVQIQTAAQLLQDLAQYADAEKIWRQYAKIDPRATILLARCVGMYGNLDEAFSLLETAAKHHPPRVLLLYGIEILRARKTDAQEKHFAKLGQWFAAARQAEPGDVQIESIVGDMWEIRGDLDKAEAVYRKLLARTDLDPTFRAGIGNNLAFILSTQRKNTDEAVKLIDDAMKVYGPSSDLLDTRGVVYLAAAKPDKAASDFKEAVLVPSAMKWVHLAFAQHDLKDDSGAVVSLKKAQEMDLKRQDLYDAEWIRYEKLARDLGLL